MGKFWILFLVLFFSTNLLDKAGAVKLELKTFDEIFGEGWWDKGEAEDLKTPPPTNFGQNVHHQIDRQNTQIGQIEHNSTDQNPSLTESDHSDNAKNGEEENEIIKEISSNEKRKIINKFNAMKEEIKQKGKFSTKEWNQIDKKIAKHLKVSRSKIYKWKKEFGLSQKRKMHNIEKKKNEQKNLIEKFDQINAELKRAAGFKNSQNELDKIVTKELGLSVRTIYNWKRELGQTTPHHKHSHSEQKELMKRFYEIKGKNPKMRNVDIAKTLKIANETLRRWKKKFERQQITAPNFVDEAPQMFRKLKRRIRRAFE